MKHAPNFIDINRIKTLVAEGDSAKEISEKLSIRLESVKSHVESFGKTKKVKSVKKKKAAKVADKPSDDLDAAMG